MSENIEFTVVEDKKSIKSKISDWYTRNKKTIVVAAVSIPSVIVAGAAVGLTLNNISLQEKINDFNEFLNDKGLVDDYQDYMINRISDNIVSED
jgi:hypothetical protein